MLFMKPLALFAFLVTSLSPVLGQAPAVISEEQSIRPTGEEFSIMMPKGYLFESGKMPYHKLELNTRLYLSASDSGPVYAVVSLSGIKSNPTLYSEGERVNSYVDAFKKFLVARLKGKDATAKLTFIGNKTLSGHNGREYQMSVGDLSGPVQVYGTRRRFYAVAFLSSKKAESLQNRFLSSFTLPDYVPEPRASVAEQNEKATAPSSAKTADENVANKPDTETPNVETKPHEGAAEPVQVKPADSTTPNGAQTKKAPISGGVLNGKAVFLPKPDYPAEARAAKVSGTVTVQVTIDEYGNVIAANPVSGHPLLQQASVMAAMQARFTPTFLMGEAVKVTGVIVYNFVAQ